jgi:quinol monooxygenase YgiN
MLKLFAGTLLLVTSFLPAAFSYAEAKDEPVTVVSHVDVLPDSYRPWSQNSAAQLFRAEIAASRKDKGMVSFGVFQETGVPNHYTIVETWHDAKDYFLHVGSPHTVQFRQKIQPLLGSPFDARTLRQLR